MRKLLGLAILALTAFPLFAQGVPDGYADGFVQVPEPGTLALLGLGLVAVMVARRGKK